jgi:hypothetical protein
MPDGGAVWTLKLQGNVQGEWVEELLRRPTLPLIREGRCGAGSGAGWAVKLDQTQ